jgi:hypothetical protein
VKFRRIVWVFPFNVSHKSCYEYDEFYKMKLRKFVVRDLRGEMKMNLGLGNMNGGVGDGERFMASQRFKFSHHNSLANL